MKQNLSDLIPDELVVAVERLATSRGRALGLRGQDLEDYIGDAFLALCLLAVEWEPERGVPIQPWVVGRLRHRMYDIARERTPGLRGGNALTEVPYSPLPTEGHLPFDPPVPEAEEVDDGFVWAVAASDRERTLLVALREGAKKQDAAAILGVHPSRVSQIIAEIRGRVRPA